MINVSNQLAVLLLLAVIGLLLTLIVFISPGWAIFKFPVEDYKDPNISKGSREDVEEAKFQKEPFVSLTSGLWYFQACFHKHGDWWSLSSRDTPCYRATYHAAHQLVTSIPDDQFPLRMIFKNIGMALQLGLLEFQIEASIGLFAALFGVIVLAIYKHSAGKRRAAGLVSCVCLITTGVIYLVAVGKVVRSIVQANVLFTAKSWITQHAPVPWCLIAAVIGATFQLVAALGVMIVLSRNRKEVIINEYVIKSHPVMGSHPFHTVTPPGFDPNQFVPEVYKMDANIVMDNKISQLPPKV